MSEQSPTRIYEKDRPIFERLRSLPMERLLKEPVSLLPLAVRAAAYCEKHNILTIGQLTQCKRAELLKARNLGRKTVAHIIAYLGELGLGLDGKLSATVPPALPPAYQRGAKAMKLAVLTHLATLDLAFDVAQQIAALPLPVPEADE